MLVRIWLSVLSIWIDGYLGDCQLGHSILGIPLRFAKRRACARLLKVAIEFQFNTIQIILHHSEFEQLGIEIVRRCR